MAKLDVSAVEFARYDNMQNRCQRCVKLAKHQADKLAQQPEPKPRTDSERYAELRALVEAFQRAKSYEDEAPLQALRDWSHR